MTAKHEVSEWKDHPYTRELAKRQALVVQNAQLELEKACRQSTDPAVRKAVADLEAAQGLLRMLKGE